MPPITVKIACRANVDHIAKTDGMDKDLGFVGNQYNTMLSIFYVPYVIFAPPIGMLGKKYGPHRVLPIMMFFFGSATLLAASVKNWSGMMALRWFLGKSSRSISHGGLVQIHDRYSPKLEALCQRSFEMLSSVNAIGNLKLILLSNRYG